MEEYLELGTHIIDGKTIEVIKSVGLCVMRNPEGEITKECMFFNEGLCPYACEAHKREDGKHVIFVSDGS